MRRTTTPWKQWLVALLATAVRAELTGNIGHADGFTPDYVLHVTLANITTACETRLSAVVNGTSPGPTIRLAPGGPTWIRVYNDMPDQNLTMHWHGLAQRMAPFADGSIMASQWPIAPQNFFDYELAIPANDSGTYYYHSHASLQALTAFGALIVEDCPQAPFKYDDERVLVFSDYYRDTDNVLEADLLSVPFKWVGETRGVLLNGLGIGVDHTAVVGPKGGTRGRVGAGFSSDGPIATTDVSTGVADAGTNCTLPVVDVDPGKTYRFRFIGGTGISLVTMALEGHENFTIMQVDGSEYNVPVDTDRLQIASGQRFDVLFKAKTADELRAENRQTYYLQYETRDRKANYTGYAVLRYNADVEVPVAPVAPVLTLPQRIYDWMEYTFVPLYPEQNRAPTPQEVTRRIIIDSVQRYNNKTGRMVWELAHLSWNDQTFTTPMLVDIYQRGAAAMPDRVAAANNYGWDPKTLSFPAEVGEVLEIVLQNTGSLSSNGEQDTHPFHTHSQHVYDLGGGDGTYDAAANDAKIEAMGYRPIKRDTTMLYRYNGLQGVAPGVKSGWRAWRIRLEQPGVWMLHCHTLMHMVMGMQQVWVVGTADEIMQVPLTAAQGYFVYGGSVLGNVTHQPQVFNYFGKNSAPACPPKSEQPPGGNPTMLSGAKRLRASLALVAVVVGTSMLSL